MGRNDSAVVQGVSPGDGLYLDSWIFTYKFLDVHLAGTEPVMLPFTR